MKCTNCGAEILDGSRFCGECGTKTGNVNTINEAEKTEKTSRRKKNPMDVSEVNVERVTLCPDGKYRWV